MDIVDTLRQVLDRTLHLNGRGLRLAPESSLLELVPELDSMTLVAFATAIETQFAFAFDDDDLIGENFATLNALADFVAQKTGR